MNDDSVTVEISVNFGATDHDLSMRLRSEATGGDLYRLLGSPESGLGLNRTPPLLTIERTGQALLHDQPLLETTLMSGDRLVSIVEPGSRQEVTAEFLTGPKQGDRFSVPVSGVTPVALGRPISDGFDDPSVSRQHIFVSMKPSALVVEDAGSTNGTVVNGRPLASGQRVDVHPGDVIELGQISWRLLSIPSESRRLPGSPFSYQRGELAFQPAPRAADPKPPSIVDLPQPPSEPTKRRFPLASAVLPLVMGAVMAYVFSPYFALFMLMGPVMVVWTFVDDRRSGRKTFRADRQRFLDELDGRRLEAADSSDRLAAWARRRTPNLDQIGRWVRVGAKELWVRRPRHDDFLLTAVGTAEQPALLEIRSPGGEMSELAQRAADVRADFGVDKSAPVLVDLRHDVVVGITGPIERDPESVAIGSEPTGRGRGDAAAIARGLVAQLVGLRSYRDLQLVVLAPEQRHEWEWCKWLPHVRSHFRSDSGSDFGNGFGSDFGGGLNGDVSGGQRLIAGSDDEAKAIFEQLNTIAAKRVEQTADRIGGLSNAGPHYLIVFHPPVGLAPAAVARFLELAPSVGMSAIFLARDRHDLPAEVAVHIEVSARGVDVHHLSAGSTVADVQPWSLSSDSALDLARDVAPIVDLTVSGTAAGIPASVSLHEANGDRGHEGDSLSDAEAVAIRWASDPKGLMATIGVAATGPLTLDLQADGPHGLVAGTTGAGKSEFLQTLIADLAANYSPLDLNFILIDYKGGSAFRQCRGLPHTVGFVTDLDEHLAERALTSLRAELRHREHVLAEAEVSDLKALRSKYRHTVNADLVLPSLVIVIDEFAALKSEVPAFVDGLVDVAQRGRSMGVHMILATQKPGGVITPQIDANTNIRVALRVANDNDSRELIGVTDAAAIATDRPGRGLLKVGGGSQPVSFQSAYVGGRSTGPRNIEPGLAPFGYRSSPGRIKAIRFEPSGVAPGVSDSSEDNDGPEGNDSTNPSTDLDAIVDAVNRAWSSEPRRPLRQPWMPTLPTVVGLEDLVTEPRSPLVISLGLADHPARQSQEPFVLDLTGAGHVAVYGAAGSGKSTFLRSVAASMSLVAERSSAHGPQRSKPPYIYGIDMGGGLAMLEPLPLVADVISGTDHERLQLLLAYLGSEVERRREHLATAGAGSLAELDPLADSTPPYTVVLIDGFGPFWDVLEKFDYGRQADDFVLLMSQARSVGIHMVMTADQRSAIPFNCLGSVGLRCVQRLASADEYRSLGLRLAPNPDLMSPGRTLVLDSAEGSVEVQVAVLAGNASGDEAVASVAEPDGVAFGVAFDVSSGISSGVSSGPAQASALAGLAERQNELGLVGASAGRRIEVLGDRVAISSVGRCQSLATVPLGLSPTGVAVSVDLADNPALLIAGSAGSGRSTTLLTLAHQLAPVVPDRRAVATKRSSPLAVDLSDGAYARTFTDVFVGDDIDPLVGLADEIEQRIENGFDSLMFVAIDDADLFFDNNQASAPLTTLVLKGRDAGVSVALSASSFRAGSAFETWIRALRSNGHGLVLMPDGEKEQDLFDVRFPRGSALRFPVGRGYLIVRSTVQAVHIATLGSEVSEAEGRM